MPFRLRNDRTALCLTHKCKVPGSYTYGPVFDFEAFQQIYKHMHGQLSACNFLYTDHFASGIERFAGLRAAPRQSCSLSMARNSARVYGQA